LMHSGIPGLAVREPLHCTVCPYRGRDDSDDALQARSHATCNQETRLHEAGARLLRCGVARRRPVSRICHFVRQAHTHRAASAMHAGAAVSLITRSSPPSPSLPVPTQVDSAGSQQGGNRGQGERGGRGDRGEWRDCCQQKGHQVPASSSRLPSPLLLLPTPLSRFQKICE